MGSRRPNGDRRSREPGVVAAEFGPSRVRLNLRTGRVTVDDAGLASADQRDDGTSWALAMLVSVGIVVDGLDLRDEMWS